MKKMMVAAIFLIAGFAHADGFVCTTESGLNVKVYNHTQAEMGTRTAAILVVSDSNVNGGNKTIARFTDAKGTLTSASTTYDANVDLRFNDSSRKGELIAGTKLGYVDHIYLDVDFSYAQPVAEGTEVAGQLRVLKRSGETITEQASCVRYLKN